VPIIIKGEREEDRQMNKERTQVNKAQAKVTQAIKPAEMKGAPLLLTLKPLNTINIICFSLKAPA